MSTWNNKRLIKKYLKIGRNFIEILKLIIYFFYKEEKLCLMKLTVPTGSAIFAFYGWLGTDFKLVMK